MIPYKYWYWYVNGFAGLFVGTISLLVAYYYPDSEAILFAPIPFAMAILFFLVGNSFKKKERRLQMTNTEEAKE